MLYKKLVHKSLKCGGKKKNTPVNRGAPYGIVLRSGRWASSSDSAVNRLAYSNLLVEQLETFKRLRSGGTQTKTSH
jgi:hypothetical protein